MAHQVDGASPVYGTSFRSEPYQGRPEQQATDTHVEDDVRRFACNRCRSQKLRCERDRVSLKSPLKSTPCRRCIKARVRCTTSSRPRAPRNTNDAVSSNGKDQAAKRRSSAGPGVRHEDCVDSDGQDGEEAHKGTGKQATHDRAHSLGGLAAPVNTATQAPDNSSHGQLNSVTARQTFSFPPAGTDPALLNDHTQNRASLPDRQQSKSPLVSVPDNVPCNTNSQHVPFSHMHISNHMTFPIDDSQFYVDLDCMMERDFKSPGAVTWPQGSLLDGSKSNTHEQDGLEFVTDSTGMDTNFHTIGQSKSDPGQIRSTLRIADTAKRPRFSGDIESGHPEFGARQKKFSSREVAAQLAQLISTILNDMNADQAGVGTPEQSMDRMQHSPMQKLIMNAERLFMIMTESFFQCPSNSSVSSDARTQDSNMDTTSGSGHASDSSWAYIPSNIKGGVPGGLAGVTTITAVFAAYSSILQMYERTYNLVHRTIVQTGRSGSLPAALYPVVAFDGVKLGGQNTCLQIHVAIEVSIQMLNQIENKLAMVVTNYTDEYEDTKASLLALLQSLTHDQGEVEVTTPSAVIRETINGSKRLLNAIL